MKKSYLILLVIIAIAIGIIASTTGSTSEYVDFNKAFAMEAEGDDEMVHVVGKLPKNSSGAIEGMQYNPALDPNYFEFILTDNANRTQKVLYFQPKPQDFDKSEQIVVIGHAKKGVFVADKILMKCPSKYEDKEVKI